MEELKKYLLDNLDELIDAVKEIHNWTGDLGHIEVFENEDEFFEMFELGGLDLMEKVYYGNYRPYDVYVRFDVNGNIESLTTKDYTRFIKKYLDEIIRYLLENKNEIFLYNGLEYMLDEIEIVEEEE